MLSAKNIAVFSVLTAGALASWYAARQQGSDSGADTVTETAHRGYYLKSARILGTGPDGSMLYEILADRAEQRDDGHIDFANVRINYSPQSDVPWSVRADTATIQESDRRILLEGHVTAVSSEGFSGNDTEIRTDYLELDPDSYFAETDRRVQIRIGTRSLTATGMLASLRENQLQLKSNVSGKFAP